jgi:hypothetical protein
VLVGAFAGCRPEQAARPKAVSKAQMNARVLTF